MKSYATDLEQEATKIKYPILAKSKDHEFIVMFTSSNHGMLVYMPEDCDLHYLGKISTTWVDITDNYTWRILPEGFEIKLVQE